MKPQQACLLAGALFGATGVGLGAWGAHGLDSFIGHADTGSWDTAVLYQLIHALGLLLVGVLQTKARTSVLAWSGYLMMIGVLLFSGSIYGLVLNGPRWLGPVTPLGGVSMILAWTLLALAAWRWPAR